jgi:hypothetical protein
VSKDFQLGFRCPHLVIEEPVGLGDDRRSLETMAPVASTQLVRVLANNQFYIPPQGLYSQAIIEGALSGPFRIIKYDEDLTVTSSTETKTVTLPRGLRVTTDTIVKLFRDVLQDIVVQNDRGYLVFADVAKIGPASRIRVSGRAYKSVGFRHQQQIRGRQVYPPWVLEKRVDTLPEVNRVDVYTHARFPKFIQPVKTNPHFKVTYTAPPSRCVRCRGTYIENDWRFNRLGEPLFIENDDLLYQAALKILLTERGSNPFHPQYGSLLVTRIGSKAVGAVAVLLNEDVRTAIARMQFLQKGQAKYQRVSLRERLYSVLAVDVRPHRNDQTAFLIDVVVTNASGEPVKISIVFSVPGAVALAGSNGQSLGLDTTGLTPAESRQVFS